MSTPIALQELVREGGIRTVNFFNGRLLTGKDMGREQAARREAVGRLGQVVGHGVATGLYVRVRQDENGRPIAQISKGMALNRGGQTLTLGRDTEIMLTEAVHPDGATIRCLFGDCAPPSRDDRVVNNGHQLYMLTIAPAFASEGRAPMNADGASIAKCNTDATVEAVQFRLIEINRSRWNGADLSKRELARNRIAHGFFGNRIAPEWGQNLSAAEIFAPNPSDIAEAEEVPLALIAFVDGLVPHFVDMWSVRRSIGNENRADAISALSGDARAKLGEAMFHQFHDQIAEIPADALMHLAENFAYLPAVGIIENVDLSRIPALFDGLTVSGPYHIDQASIEPLVRESLTAPAIDMRSDHAIWLYRIAQNEMSKKQSKSTLIFASGHLPYRGDARFNLNYWNYANYALIA